MATSAGERDMSLHRGLVSPSTKNLLLGLAVLSTICFTPSLGNVDLGDSTAALKGELCCCCAAAVRSISKRRHAHTLAATNAEGKVHSASFLGW